MSDETPMDLRSLGEVDSPEVVRQALSGFRKRFVRTMIWVVVVVVAISSTIVARSVKKDLEERIRDARGVVPGTVYTRNKMTAILAKVADLGDQTGFHVIVSQPSKPPQYSTGRDLFELNAKGVEFSSPFTGEEGPLYDYFFSMKVPPSGRIEIEVQLSCQALPEQFNEHGYGFCHIGPPFPTLDPIVIDLNELGVPRSIWQGGSR